VRAGTGRETSSRRGGLTGRVDGLVDLPAFNPDDDGDRLPAAVAGLRRQFTAQIADFWTAILSYLDQA
jgi:hypothetical protein